MDEQNKQNEQKSPYDKLKPVYRRAVDLRLRGLPYRAIADILIKAGHKVTEHTLRVWFMQNGKCYEAFSFIQNHKAEEIEGEMIDINSQLIEGAQDAIAVLREAVITGNVPSIQLRAAEDILDRAGFPRKTAVDSKTTIEMSLEMEKQKRLDELSNSLKALVSNLHDDPDDPELAAKYAGGNADPDNPQYTPV